MTSRIGYFIGMALADVRHFFRGRQAVPCLVDWDEEPPVIIDQSAQRVEFARPVRVFIGDPDSFDSAAPKLSDISKMQEVKGLSGVAFNYDPTDDCCPDYEVDCCITTDTIGEFEGKA